MAKKPVPRIPISVRFPVKTHRDLKRIVTRRGGSANDYIVAAVTAKLEQELTTP